MIAKACGTTSSRTGGSFEQRALNAAIGRLFNDYSHMMTFSLALAAMAALDGPLPIGDIAAVGAGVALWIYGDDAAKWLQSQGSVLFSDGAESGDESRAQQPSRPGKMQQEVEKGSAPPSIERVDKGRGPFEQDHIHFGDKNKSALNVDGTWKHGEKELTGRETKWINQHGWNLPKK